MSRPDLPRWAGWVVRALLPADVAEEITGDLDERYRALRVGKGRSRAEWWLVSQIARLRPLALRRALRARSDRGAAHSRDGSRGGMMMGWRGDVRQTWRSLWRQPGFTMTVVATVGLAIGATTSVFTVVNGVLLRPLDFEEPDRLVLAWQTRPDWRDHPSPQLSYFAESFPLSVPTFFDWQAGRTGFSSMGLYTGHQWILQGASGAEVVRGLEVTSGVFGALGIPAALGRTMQPADDEVDAPGVVVLSHARWRDHHESDPGVIGQTLSMDGHPRVVIGVMPAGFDMPAQTGAEAWASLAPGERRLDRDSQSYTVLGRLADGVTLESAQADLFAIQERLGVEFPDVQGNMRARVEGLLPHLVGGVRDTLVLLLVSVGLVLAIACVNIANMLSVRGLARSRELAIRAALGASRFRRMRQLCTESLILAGAGGMLGVFLAIVTLPVLLDLLPPNIPRTEAIQVDGRVLLFGILITATTAVLVGLLPAVQAAGAAPKRTIDANGRGLAGGRGGGRVRAGLVVTEMTLAFLLLVGAGLIGQSFVRLWNVDRGFEPEGLVTLVATPDRRTYTDPGQRNQFAADLRERLSSIPGARVTRTNQIPLSGSTSTTTYYIDTEDGEPIAASVMISVVGREYFDVMEIPSVSGRVFDEGDLPDGPLVAVANQALVDLYWPDESPIGQTLRSSPEAPLTAIVGVVGDVRHASLSTPPQPKLYVPAAQDDRTADQWLIRVSSDAGSVVSAAREAVTQVSPSTPVRRVGVLQDRIAESVSVPRFRTAFVLGLAGLATLLALVGVYGVVAFTVSQRSRELAVRMAIGARPETVLLGTIFGGLRLAGLAVGIGVVVAWQSSRWVESFLFDVDPVNPTTYLVVGVAIAAVSSVASWLPARRAARVDPVTVLKSE